MQLKARMLKSKGELSFAGISPGGAGYVVTDDGRFSQEDGFEFKTGVKGCNGVAFTPRRIVVCGRSDTRLFTRNGTVAMEAALGLGSNGCATSDDGVVLCTFGKKGFTALSLGKEPTQGAFFGKAASPTLPSWITTPSHYGTYEQIQDLQLGSPEWIETSVQRLEAVFSGGTHGILKFTCGRTNPSCFALRGFEMSGLDIVSVSMSKLHDVIVAADYQGTLCVFKRASYHLMLCFKLNAFEHYRVYKLVCAGNSLALLTDQGLVWVPNIIDRINRGELTPATRNLQLGWLPHYSGVDIVYVKGKFVITQPRIAYVIEESDICRVAEQQNPTDFLQSEIRIDGTINAVERELMSA